MKKLQLIYLAGICCCLLIACAKDDPKASEVQAPTLPAQLYDYSTADLSMHPELDFNPNNGDQFNLESIDDARATLGRVLFYDTKLSVNNRISCGSCHHQQLGFGDVGRSSTGFNNQVTPRNSMALSNLFFANQFFWDVRVNTLEDLVLQPIQNHIEMGMENLDVLEDKLAAADYYPPLFDDAFGSEDVTRTRISMAVADFLRSMISFNAKYDQGRDSDFSNYTPMEKMGMDLFRENGCEGCHSEPTFASRWGSGVANIGLDLEYTDQGAGAVPSEPIDPNGSGPVFFFGNGSFKIPSLRNIAMTAPYMHDGRFNTLEEVIDHYNEGIQGHPNLDWRLQDFDFNTGIGSPKRMNLDELEKMALVAFLKTLTDDDFLHDARFSNPFQE